MSVHLSKAEKQTPLPRTPSPQNLNCSLILLILKVIADITSFHPAARSPQAEGCVVQVYQTYIILMGGIRGETTTPCQYHFTIPCSAYVRGLGPWGGPAARLQAQRRQPLTKTHQKQLHAPKIQLIHKATQRRSTTLRRAAPLSPQTLDWLRSNKDKPISLISKHLGVCEDTAKRVLARNGLRTFDGAKYAIPPQSKLWTRPCIRCRSTIPRPKNLFFCNPCRDVVSSYG